MIQIIGRGRFERIHLAALRIYARQDVLDGAILASRVHCLKAHGNIPMCAQAMKAGAIDFLPKPFKLNQLLQSVERPLTRSSEQLLRASERNHARALLQRLTPREYEVMELVATGLLNKQVGGELGMAEKTVKTHRAHMMQKLKITSVAELMVILQKAEVTPPVKPGTKV